MKIALSKFTDHGVEVFINGEHLIIQTPVAHGIEPNLYQLALHELIESVSSIHSITGESLDIIADAVTDSVQLEVFKAVLSDRTV